MTGQNVSYPLLDLPLPQNPNTQNEITINVKNIYRNLKQLLFSGDLKYMRTRALIGWSVGSLCVSFMVSRAVRSDCNCYGGFCQMAIKPALFFGIIGGYFGTHIFAHSPYLIAILLDILKEYKYFFYGCLSGIPLGIPIILGISIGSRR